MFQLVAVLTALVSERLPRSEREKGATAVEYGLIVALIAAVVIGAVFVLGGTVRGIFTDTNACISNPAATAENC